MSLVLFSAIIHDYVNTSLNNMISISTLITDNVDVSKGILAYIGSDLSSVSFGHYRLCLERSYVICNKSQ